MILFLNQLNVQPGDLIVSVANELFIVLHIDTTLYRPYTLFSINDNSIQSFFGTFHCKIIKLFEDVF